jgi:hypothetical protein
VRGEARSEKKTIRVSALSHVPVLYGVNFSRALDINIRLRFLAHDGLFRHVFYLLSSVHTFMSCQYLKRSEACHLASVAKIYLQMSERDVIVIYQKNVAMVPWMSPSGLHEWFVVQ